MVTLNDFSVEADSFYDLEKTISLFEIGTDVLKIFKNQAPEKRHLSVKRWSRQIIWNKLGMSQKKIYEGIIDLRDVKDIRSGKNSSNFELSSKLLVSKIEELDEDRCFVVCYTRGFNIKTLSICAKSENERDDWVKGLRSLTHDTVNASYPVQMERWLWKEFYRMTSEKENVTLKDVRAFLPQVNCQIPKTRLQEVFREVNNRNIGELAFDEFASLCNRLTYDEKIFESFFSKYSSGENTITLSNFKAFIAQQGDGKAFQDSDVLMAAFMRDFSRDPRQNNFANQDYEKGFFTDEEFISYLFSRHNELLDPQHKNVHQDMTQPLSSYWIASSHNTYLTGDQIKSLSSCDAYARCLMRGCRCIELDCWDGADGIPYIYHGFTFTSKISFLDVVKTIKEYAFTTSTYPVILSIENHCSLPQQTKMAEIFEEIFGSMLLKLPIELEDKKMLPSPQDLQGKIVVKNKKLPEKSTSCSSLSAYCPKNDSEHSCKEGVLYLRDKTSGDWVSHLFVLNDTKMFYTKFQCNKSGPNKEEEEEEDDDNEEENYVYQPIPEDVAEYELHFSEIWFHGHLDGGKDKSKELLEEYGPKLGDGTFLVRNSESLIGDFSISFWYKEKVYNIRIKSRVTCSPSGKRKKDFYLKDGPFFDSMCSLVEHYKTNPYEAPNFKICFDKPVPHLRTHLGKNWFHPNIGQTEAVELLRKIPKSGAFLVRPSDNDPDAFTISFRTETEIKHCRIKQDGRLFMIGRAQFASLVDLINHYQMNPFYGQVHLRYPVTEESIQNYEENPQAGKEISCLLEDPSSYMESAAFIESMGISVKTLQSYKARKNDELSFPKDAIIKNVKKVDTEWWRGDYRRKIQGFFLAEYTQEIDYEEAKRHEEENSADGIAKGLRKRDVYFDVMGARAELSKMNRSTNQNQSSKMNRSISQNQSESTEQTVDVGVIPKWLLLVKLPSQTEMLELGVDSREDALNWVEAIRDANGCETDPFDDQENNDTIQYSEIEKKCGIARGLSDIIVYCQAKQFNQEDILRKGRNPCEMSSFCETKAEKLLILQETQFFFWYHQVMFSRIYPAGLRIDSSNYNPVPFWNVGSQLVALNYQTPDRSMQLNEAKFLQNGKCGYVLKPNHLRQFSRDYNPPSVYSPADEDLVSFVVMVISGRHLITRPNGLTASLSGVVSPYVEIEIIGCDEDMTSTNKHTTKTIPDNGFNPFWDETFQFHVSRPSLAFLRFTVYDRDSFGDSRFVAQATYPLSCIRRGFRSVPLCNDFSELLEMSSLLIFLDYIKREKELESLDVGCSAQRIGIYRRLKTQISNLAESWAENAAVKEARSQLEDIELKVLDSNRLANISN